MNLEIKDKKLGVYVLQIMHQWIMDSAVSAFEVHSVPSLGQ